MLSNGGEGTSETVEKAFVHVTGTACQYEHRKKQQKFKKIMTINFYFTAPPIGIRKLTLSNIVKVNVNGKFFQRCLPTCL